MAKKLSRTGPQRPKEGAEIGRPKTIKVPLNDGNADDPLVPEGGISAIPDRDLRVQVPMYRAGQTKATTYTKDFGPLVTRYPHHEKLVRHLILGAELHRKRTSSQTVSGAYTGIEALVTFLNDPRWVTTSTVRTVADLSLDVCASFRSYLVATYPQRSANEKQYAAIRQAVYALQDAYPSHESIGERRPWPIAPTRATQVTEAYSLDLFQTLVTCCVEDIRAIIAAHDRYENLIVHGERLRADDITLDNVMWWLAFASPSMRRDRIGKVKELQWVQDFCAGQGLSVDDLLTLYRDEGDTRAARGTNPFGPRVTWGRASDEKQVRNLDLATATLAAQFPTFPFHMSLADAINFYKDADRRTIAGKQGDFEAKLVSAIRFSKACHGIETGIGAYVSYRHFTSATLYPFFLYLQLQIGWNAESLLALPAVLTGNLRAVSDDFENLTSGIGPDMIDPRAATLITSIKRRVGMKKKPTLVLHRCYKDDRFGAFAMLTYIAEKVAAYRDTPSYLPGTLWQFVLDPTRWSRAGRLVGTFTGHHTTLAAASTAFLKRHGIEGIQGAKGVEDAINTRRVRSTYATLRFMQGKDVPDIQRDMDHASQETTDTSYLSDSATVDAKNRGLFPVLAEWADNLTSHNSGMARSITYEKLRENILAATGKGDGARDKAIARHGSALGLTREDIVHIISDDGDTYIAACKNARAPTWPGHEEAVRPGKRCGAFNRCCLCTQAVIFADSLPYIARRILAIESFAGPMGLTSVDWASAYGDEVAAWREILARWEIKGPLYKEQVDEAWRAARAGDVVLPTLMRVWR